MCSLLESIDVGEARTPIKIEVEGSLSGGPKPAPAPAPAAVAMPEGAVPVYGDELPDAPSYKNPVVVAEPEDQPLPKRRSAA